MTICEDAIYDGIDEPYDETTDDRADHEYDNDKVEYCSLSCKQDIKMEHNTMEVDPNMWIIDSGSTSRMRFSKISPTNLVQWKAPITLGNRQHIFNDLKGTFKGQVFSENGMLLSVTMDDVLYIPDLMMKLCSRTKALQNTQIGFERIDKYLAVIINGNKLVFNKEVKGGSGVLLGVDIYPIANDKLVEHATTIISHERLYEKLGHPHQTIVTETTNKYGWNIKPPIDATCTSCSKGNG
jgi:hypothetical protein